jgi:hypothetical protein
MYLPAFAKWIDEAEADAEAALHTARSRREDAERLRRCADLWSDLSQRFGNAPISDLKLVPRAGLKPLREAGLTTFAELVRFWFSTSAEERAALPRVGDVTLHKVMLALRYFFNEHAPPELRDPPMGRGPYWVAENDKWRGRRGFDD